MAAIYNRPPTKPPQEITPNSSMWIFIRDLLRSVYLIWDRTKNSTVKLYADATATGNVGTGEDTLLSYELNANTLQAGSTVRIQAWGSTANNGNSKTLKLYFGSLILSNSLPISVLGQWSIDALIIPTAGNAQSYYAKLFTLSTQDIESGTLTEDDSQAITIRVTGEGIATDDIIQSGMSIEYLY